MRRAGPIQCRPRPSALRERILSGNYPRLAVNPYALVRGAWRELHSIREALQRLEADDWL